MKLLPTSHLAFLSHLEMSSLDYLVEDEVKTELRSVGF